MMDMVRLMRVIVRRMLDSGVRESVMERVLVMICRVIVLRVDGALICLLVEYGVISWVYIVACLIVM